MQMADSENLITKQSVKISKNGKNLWIMPLSEERIRFVFSLSDNISKQKSNIIESQPAFAGWSADEQSDKITVKTEKLSVKADKQSLQVEIYDLNGKLIYKENPVLCKEIEPVDVIKTRSKDDDSLKMEITADGLRVRAQNLESYVDRRAAQIRLHFDFQPDEALYGLGSHEEGVGNLRGSHQYIYQQNMKACVPVIVSTKGYGLLFDSSCFMTFRDDNYGSYMWFECLDQLDYVFYAGENLQQLNSHYYTLTGKPPLLPRWSFGYVQSKERYVDAQELIEVVKEHRQRKIPLDCIVLDWRSWEGDLWGEKNFDFTRFPQPSEMVNKLHDMKTKMMISIWPNMAPGGSNSAQMLEKGYMLGNQSTYNAFSKEARDLYWQQASKGLFSSGLDAWWCDCTEPFEGDWKGSIKPEPEARIAINCDEARKYLDPSEINAYSLLHSKGIYEGQRSENDHKRVINLTRSSYAGQHRYATITWSGDTAASWEMFKSQITAATNFCVTGEPYWTYDIGAFFVYNKEQWFWSGQYNDGCDDPAYREFYLRMFQFAVFLPMFRSHGTDTPREAWRFGQPGEDIYEAILKSMRLRYSLLPYIYSLAGKITHDSGYMIAPPGMVFPQDVKTHSIKDAIMFGESLLIYPVTESMFYNRDGKKTAAINIADLKKELYLPEGSDWYDFWTGEKYTGGQTIEAMISLENIPVFVKAGSIIPLTCSQQVENAECSSDITTNNLEIRVYAGADSRFDLYEDEGDGYGYEQGRYAVTTFEWSDRSQKLKYSTKGDFPGFNNDKKINITVMM